MPLSRAVFSASSRRLASAGASEARNAIAEVRLELVLGGEFGCGIGHAKKEYDQCGYILLRRRRGFVKAKLGAGKVGELGPRRPHVDDTGAPRCRQQGPCAVRKGIAACDGEPWVHRRIGNDASDNDRCRFARSSHDSPGHRHARSRKGVGHTVQFARRFRAVHRGTRCAGGPYEHERGKQDEAPYQQAFFSSPQSVYL